MTTFRAGCKRVLALGQERIWSRSEAPVKRSEDESGAVLILALVFLVAVSLIVTGLLGWVGTSLKGTAAYSYERNVEFAATDAVNLAVQGTRYTFDPYGQLDAAAPLPCLSSSPMYAYPVPNEQASTISVYCTMLWQPYSANTRVITYSACLTSATATPAACAAAPLLQAVVAFDDNQVGSVAPALTPEPCTSIASGGYCGESMTQQSWQWNPVVPTVTSVSPTGGQSAGGTTVFISGTGFTAGSTVNLVQESGNAPVNPPNAQGYNPPVSATLVTTPAATCALPSCLEVTSPTVLTGTSYFVTVSTPGGTSAYSAIYSYNTPTVPTPVVVGLSGAVTTGSITGGNTVTILGTNFWAANSSVTVQVNFCPVAGGSCVPSPSNTTSGVVVSLPQGTSPYESVSALSPAVSTPATYYLQVVVQNVQSALTSNAEFTYDVQVPIVTSVSPTTAVAPGATVTITGYNFIPNMTVGFCPYVTTAPYYSATCVSAGGNNTVTIAQPSSTNTLTLTLPNLGGAAGAVYFPVLALPQASYSIQTYTPALPYLEPADELIYS